MILTKLLGNYARKGIIACTCLSMLLLAASTTADAKIRATADVKTESTAKPEVLGYVGNVTGKVNVRVAAGEKNDKLMLDGKSVQLQEGEKVVILSEEKVGKKPWYEISFTRDGKELTGYATSTYIKKTKTAITPEPTATPTPEPTATPVPTTMPTITPMPTEQPVMEEKTVNEGNSNKFLYLGIGVVLCIGIGAIIIANNRKKQEDNTEETNSLTKKVEELKNIKLSGNDNQEKPIAVMKRRPEVKKSVIKEESNTQVSYPNVYVKAKEPSISEEFAAAKENEDPSINMAKQDEKQALRTAIENLREHDIVIHKYFGKGEVFDNSDVRLIEVRFNGDARFLNKESLASKKLLTITNERRR